MTHPSLTAKIVSTVTLQANASRLIFPHVSVVLKRWASHLVDYKLIMVIVFVDGRVFFKES